MELSWAQAEQLVAQHEPALMVPFDFDRMDDTSFFYSGLTRYVFPKTDVWNSPGIHWVRVGLGVFDFKLATTHVPEPEGLVTMKKRVGDTVVKMTVNVTEVYMQTQEMGLSAIFDEEHVGASSVCGRAVMSFVAFEVGIGPPKRARRSRRDDLWGDIWKDT